MRVGDMSKATVGIYSYARGATHLEPQFEFDLEKFRDPIGSKQLKAVATDGTHEEVKKWIMSDPRMVGIIDQCKLLAEDHIRHGGFKWLSIGFTDYHGRWISRAVAEIVADSLAGQFEVGVFHGPTS